MKDACVGCASAERKCMIFLHFGTIGDGAPVKSGRYFLGGILLF